jgi:hypothetical protein
MTDSKRPMDNVTLIRPGAQDAPSTPPALPVTARDMDLAIDDQRMKLWEVGSIIESVALALKAHFGQDWPADIPHFAMALGVAARTINEVTGDLEMAVIEDRARQIAAESRDGR